MHDVAVSIWNSLPELSMAGMLVLLFFGTFISEDAATIAAGTAVANGALSFPPAVAACMLGIFVGDMLLFGAGRVIGERIFTNAIIRRFVSERRVSSATRWLEDNAVAAIFLSRFVSGLRLPTYLAAGALRTDVRRFAFYFFIAAALWTPTIIAATAFSYDLFLGANALIVIVAAFVALRVGIKYASYPNRRLLLGKIRRLANWEFWPVHVFYAPVVLYVLFLALRYRSFTVFTAANPGMLAGGFKGESKSDIYKQIDKGAPGLVPEHTLVPRHPSTRIRLTAAWRFKDVHNLSFPMVVKPDVGERGKGVCIVNSFDELHDVIMTTDLDLLLQRHVPGVEASVFYYRHPNEDRGRIFSITDKRFPVIVGDGRSTIEELILRDARAVCLAHKYFEQNETQLTRVLEVGEEYSLIQIGTHSRGAIFADGEWLRSHALETRIDKVSRSIDGFYFGRYDLRAGSFADLRNGEFEIIELNGVTSESTNIYDPRYSLLDAYRILFDQWRIAFEIGAENTRLGVRSTRLVDLLRLAHGRTLSDKPGLGSSHTLSGEI